ncbi:hypothetical protein EYM_03075 [Ignicoccus islandicus DSM 13165]|uniref:AAA+ ATPase domain-containing protein n=1 Tax=Ignicoccus islandicus DSM 13165 TaxID=940295 RepID=A0A0U3FQ16_9CREN|nr:ATP-binding protein [Ignicoccus islandicus]ALU12383.1 hypothetical protein EYM_03075 [Ignicoccus islandicus DSM 13165]
MNGATRVDVVDQNKTLKNAEVLKLEHDNAKTYMIIYKKRGKQQVLESLEDEFYVLPIVNKFQKTVVEELDSKEETPLIYKLKIPSTFLSSEEIIRGMIRPLVRYYIPSALEEYDVNLAYSIIDAENNKRRIAFLIALKPQCQKKIKLIPITISSDVEKLTREDVLKIFRRERNELRRILKELERIGEVPSDFTKKLTIQNFLLVRIANIFEEDEVVVDDDDDVSLSLKLRKPTWDLSQFPRELSEQVRTIVINPILGSKKYALKGIIVTGPPGMGKSVLVEAISKELNRKLLDIDPSTYRSMWYGQTEKILKSIFDSIKNRSDITVLIDDAEFLASRTMAVHEGYLAEVSVFLKMLQEERKPLIALTANHPEIIDQALIRPGRIDAIIVMGYPDKEFREKIITNALRRYDVKLASHALLEDMVRITRWFSAAEIDAFVRMAAMKGNGKIDRDSIWWARRKFNINENDRKNLQERIIWSLKQVQGIVIDYVKTPDKI